LRTEHEADHLCGIPTEACMLAVSFRAVGLAVDAGHAMVAGLATSALAGVASRAGGLGL